MVNVVDYVEDELLSCLCSMLRTEGRPACECHHFGGEVPPVGDRCQANAAGENGQVWVRRVSQTVEPDPDTITFSGFPCGGFWQAQIELGIYRCISAIPDRDGNAPPPAAYDADRDLLAADRATLTKVLCCWPLAGSAPAGFEFDMSGIMLISAVIEPTGPTGGCAGSIMTIAFSSPLVAPELADPVTQQIFVSGPAGGG